MMVKPAPPKKKRKNKKKADRSGGLQDGVMTLSRSELVATIEIAANGSTAGKSFPIIPDTFSFLKGIGASFDRVRWNSIKFYYKPAVGTTFGGLVSMGVDWDNSPTTIDRSKVSSMTPNMTCAAWHDGEKTPLVLPASRLQSRSWYVPNATDAKLIDKGPGALVVAASVSKQTTQVAIGEVWVHYSVTMQGTTSA